MLKCDDCKTMAVIPTDTIQQSKSIPADFLLRLEAFLMKKIFLLSILIGVILAMSGCRTGTRHPTKDRSEWGKDHAACEQIIRQGVRENPESYDTLDEMKLIKSCMQKKGWRK